SAAPFAPRPPLPPGALPVRPPRAGAGASSHFARPTKIVLPSSVHEIRRKGTVRMPVGKDESAVGSYVRSLSDAPMPVHARIASVGPSRFGSVFARKTARSAEFLRHARSE